MYEPAWKVLFFCGFLLNIKTAVSPGEDIRWTQTDQSSTKYQPLFSRSDKVMKVQEKLGNSYSLETSMQHEILEKNKDTSRKTVDNKILLQFSKALHQW